MTRGEGGAAMLEVFIALMVLSVAGLGLIQSLSLGQHALSHAITEERRVRDANRVLGVMSLLGRDDLVRRLGMHQTGPFMVEVQRPVPELYRITVRDTTARAAALLVTVVHRPEPAP